MNRSRPIFVVGLLIALVVGLITGTGSAQAATSGTVSITVTVAHLEISLTPTAWAPGTVTEGSSPTTWTDTTTADGGFFTVTNTCNVPTDLNAKVDKGVSTWTLADTPGANTFSVLIGTTVTQGTNPTTTALKATDQIFKSNLAATTNHKFDLWFKAPTSNTLTDPQSISVIITAQAHL